MKAKRQRYFQLREFDGPDLLTVIQSLGGIRPPLKGVPQMGLYDGYEDVPRGESMLIIYRTGLAPDDLRERLKDSGFHFESTSEMYDAIERVKEDRRAFRSLEAERSRK